MKSSSSHDVMLRALSFAYDKALEGAPGLASAKELGDEYANTGDTLFDAINSLIRWQVAKVSATGFLTGLPGLIATPVTIPADLASSLYVQTRMAAAIAHMCGLDPHSDRVRTFVYITLCGDGAKEVLKGVGVKVGEKFAYALLKKLPGPVLTKINQAIGFRLLTKFGTRSVLQLFRLIPLIGGGVSAVLNATWCNAVGNSARDLFMELGTHDNKAA